MKLKVFLGGGVLQAGLVITQFFVSVLLAHLLGVKSFGVYSFVTSIALVASTPFQTGVRTSGIRFFVTYKNHNDSALLRGAWTTWSKWILLYGSLVTGILLLYLLFFSRNDTQEVIISLITICGLIFLYPFISLHGAALQASGLPLKGQIPEFLVRPYFYLALILIVWFLFKNEKLKAYDAVLLNVIAAMIALLAAKVWISGRWGKILKTTVKEFEYKKWAKSLITLALAGGMITLNGQIDLLFLGWFEGPSHVGPYRVAVQMGTLVTTALIAVNRLVAPKVVELYTLDKLAELSRLLAKAALIVFIAAMVPAVIFIVYGKVLLSHIFGDDFLGAYIPLVVFCLCRLISASAGVVGVVLSVTGHERDTVKAVVGALVIGIALNFILIPRFHALGAAISSGCSLILWNFYMVILVHRRIGLNATVFRLSW